MKQTKPRKPSPSYLLTPHASGKRSKEIRGRTYYFGRWEDPQGALREFLKVKDDLVTGLEPNPQSPRPTAITDQSLIPREFEVEPGEISPRHSGVQSQWVT